LQDLQERDPRRIGPYRLAGRLGAGGMGRVYVGRSPAGRLVAVKVIREELAADPEFLVRFAREVSAARSVSGMFTAPVVDADTAGPEPWLATAYVAGPSLAQAVRDHGPLPAATARALAAGLAEGLAAVHAAGLVHRDLKPSNVLLAEDGPRVIDFGISQAAEGTSLTHTGLVLGSPGFMSPEQATTPPAPLPVPVTPVTPVGLPAPPTRRAGRRLVVLAVCAALLLVAGTAGALALDRGHGQSPGAVVRTSGAAAAVTATSSGTASAPSPAAASSGSIPQVTTGQTPGAPKTQPAPKTSGHPSSTVTSSRSTPPSPHTTGPAGSTQTGSPPVITPTTSTPALAPPSTPQSVTATANGGYQVTVSWADSSPGITGYNVDNGCPVGLCGGPDAELYKTTGPVNSTTFPVDPGSWTCFRAQAISSAGNSAFSGYGCVQTPGLTISGATEWTSTGLTLNPGDRMGITAAGTVHIDPSYPVGPGGTASCTPAKTYPASATTFPDSAAPCWSLIARIGNGAPFAVGPSLKFTATAAGVLYLGVNDNNFTDNSGSWKVNIEKGGGLPPAP
jgi:hypothetical protein